MAFKKFFCPLLDEPIYAIDCFDNMHGTETHEIMEDWYADYFKKKKNWIEICENCKHYKDWNGDD